MANEVPRTPVTVHATPESIRRVMALADRVGVVAGERAVVGHLAVVGDGYRVELEEPVDPGESVEVRFFQGGQRYRAFFAVLRSEPKRLWLGLPREVRQRDRRRFPRQSAQGWVVRWNRGLVELIDVSVNGAALRIHETGVGPGDKLQLSLSYEGGLPSEVTYLVREVVEEPGGTVVRGSFLPPDPDDSRELTSQQLEDIALLARHTPLPAPSRKEDP